MHDDKNRNDSSLYGIIGGSPERARDSNSRSRSAVRQKGGIEGKIFNQSSFDLIKGYNQPIKFAP